MSDGNRSSNKPLRLHGALTALVTPMKDGRVDDDALTALVEAQIEAGIDGLVPCGTTGESATLSYQEHIHVVEVVHRAAAGRVPILAGAGANSTHEAVSLARACKEIGVEATLQVTPYYNKPPQAGLLRHFTTIADEVGLPVVLYNVPGRTGCDILPETVAKLAEHEMIIGIKEATGDMHRASQVRAQCGEAFSLLSGDDHTILPFIACGGDGVVSVVSNPVPGLIAELCRAAREGKNEEARQLHDRQLPLSRALFAEANPIPAKLAMSELGFGRPEVRLPLVEMQPDDPRRTGLLDALRTCGGFIGKLS